MITWMTKIGWYKTMETLFDPQLEQQREDALDILKFATYNRDLEGLQNDPLWQSALMWQGYERALCSYASAACRCWRINRKHSCNLYSEFIQFDKILKDQGRVLQVPPWNDDTTLMISHRAELIRQNREYASVFPNNPDVPLLLAAPDPAGPDGYKLVECTL